MSFLFLLNVYVECHFILIYFVSSIVCRIKYLSVQYFVSYVCYLRMYFYVFIFVFSGARPKCPKPNLSAHQLHPTPPTCMDAMHVPSPRPFSSPTCPTFSLQSHLHAHQIRASIPCLHVLSSPHQLHRT